MDDQKKRWKEEAEQLKKDMDNRSKVFKKNEVRIKFPSKRNRHVSENNVKPPQGSSGLDDFYKQQINFVDND